MPRPQESGHPLAGDRPKERRTPTLGLEGTNRRTGRHYFLTMSVTASSSWTSANTCQRSRVAVVLWFGAWCVALGSLLLFPSLFSSLALLLTLCQLRSCLRQFSSTLTEQSSCGSGAHVFVARIAERARRACQDVSVVYATERAYHAMHEQFCDGRCCSFTVQALTLH